MPETRRAYTAPFFAGASDAYGLEARRWRLAPTDRCLENRSKQPTKGGSAGDNSEFGVKLATGREPLREECIQFTMGGVSQLVEGVTAGDGCGEGTGDAYVDPECEDEVEGELDEFEDCEDRLDPELKDTKPHLLVEFFHGFESQRS